MIWWEMGIVFCIVGFIVGCFMWAVESDNIFDYIILYVVFFLFTTVGLGLMGGDSGIALGSIFGLLSLIAVTFTSFIRSIATYQKHLRWKREDNANLSKKYNFATYSLES